MSLLTWVLSHETCRASEVLPREGRVPVVIVSEHSVQSTGPFNGVDNLATHKKRLLQTITIRRGRTIGVRGGGVSSHSSPLETIFDPPTPGEHFRPPQASRWFQGQGPIYVKVPSLSSVKEIIFSRLRRAKIVLCYIREYRSDNFYLSGKHL